MLKTAVLVQNLAVYLNSQDRKIILTVRDP